MTKNLYETELFNIETIDLFKIISKAFTNIVRVKTLLYLFENPEVRYTELLKKFKQNDSGYFSFNMRWLKKAQLVLHDERRNLYSLSSLGYDCISFMKRIEQRQMGIGALNESGIFDEIDDPEKYIDFMRTVINYYKLNIEAKKLK